MEKWGIEIKKVNNGFIVEYTGDKQPDVYETRHEDTKTGKEDLTSIKYMLYDILEHFAIFYSDHNEYNIRIDIVDKNGKAIKDV